MKALPDDPADRQACLIERYSIIDDPQERLAAIISRPMTLPGVPEESRSEHSLVGGCQSKVWITGRLEDGRCRFAMDSSSAMVRGLVALLCEVYEGGTPETVLAVEPELFERLGVSRNLTPTRLNGLAAVRLHLRRLALELAGSGESA